MSGLLSFSTVRSDRHAAAMTSSEADARMLIDFIVCPRCRRERPAGNMPTGPRLRERRSELAAERNAEVPGLRIRRGLRRVDGAALIRVPAGVVRPGIQILPDD